MDVRVGIAGATGALGSEVVRVLDKAPWRPSQVVPMASARTTVSSVTYGEQRVTVEDLAFEAFGELDALIVALPSAVATESGAAPTAQLSTAVEVSTAPLAAMRATTRGQLGVVSVEPTAQPRQPSTTKRPSEERERCPT